MYVDCCLSVLPPYISIITVLMLLFVAIFLSSDIWRVEKFVHYLNCFREFILPVWLLIVVIKISPCLEVLI